VAGVSYRSNTEVFWDEFTVSLLIILLIGIVIMLMGEKLYRLLLKHSNIKHRQFYFKDDE